MTSFMALSQDNNTKVIKKLYCHYKTNGIPSKPINAWGKNKIIKKTKPDKFEWVVRVASLCGVG